MHYDQDQYRCCLAAQSEMTAPKSIGTVACLLLFPLTETIIGKNPPRTGHVVAMAKPEMVQKTLCYVRHFLESWPLRDFRCSHSVKIIAKTVRLIH